MRIKLELSLVSKERIIPVNYNYPISSWIYKTLLESNRGFADWLHNKGYELHGKTFKLFCFSQLIGKTKFLKPDRLEILDKKVFVCLSFLIDESASEFIHSVFQKNDFELGDKISKVKFQVNSITTNEKLTRKNEYRFKTISPICVSRATDQGKQAEYVHPYDKDYPNLIFRNLLNKRLASKKSLTLEKNEPSFEILSEPQSKLITIASHSERETRVRGYHFHFLVSGLAELIDTGYYAGFGEKNSLGFGLVEEIK